MLKALCDYVALWKKYDCVVLPDKEYYRRVKELKQDGWEMFAFLPKRKIVILRKGIKEYLMQVSELGRDNMVKMWKKRRGEKENIKREWWKDKVE